MIKFTLIDDFLRWSNILSIEIARKQKNIFKNLKVHFRFLSLYKHTYFFIYTVAACLN